MTSESGCNADDDAHSRYLKNWADIVVDKMDGSVGVPVGAQEERRREQFELAYKRKTDNGRQVRRFEGRAIRRLVRRPIYRAVHIPLRQQSDAERYVRAE